MQSPVFPAGARAAARVSVNGFRIDDAAIAAKETRKHQHVADTAMPPSPALEAEVEVGQRYSVVTQVAALPLEDLRLHLGDDHVEVGAQRLVEQRPAVCSGAPNPPGYESLSGDGREGGGCLHSPHMGWLTKGRAEGDWAR